jgi:hypothetical protein
MLVFEHPGAGSRPVNRIRHLMPGPELVNLQNARTLGGNEMLEFREQRWRIRSVDYDSGLELLERTERLKEVAGDRSAYRAALAVVVEQLGRMARPAGWRGWLWLWRKNPFRDATLAEVMDLVGFFGRCQTISRVRHRFQEDRSSRSTS